MILSSLDRLSRDVHRRLGEHIARKDAIARRRSNEALAQRIKQTYDKINMGCGKDRKLSGYLNVDIEPSVLPDALIVDDDDSMIPRQHFQEVFAKDVLEHIPRHRTLAALLGWSDYLGDGGKLILQTSSILDVAEKLRERTRYADHHGWTICLFGNQAHSADFHHTGFTEVTLRVHLLAAGFSVEALGL